MPPAPQPPYQTPFNPWAAPPPARPEKSPVGLTIGIIGGIFLLIVVLLATLVLTGKTIESTYPRAESALTVPGDLVDGRYKLTEDESPTLGRKLEGNWRLSWDAKAVHGVVAVYLPPSGDRGELVVTGMYGRFRNTERVRARVLADNSGGASRAQVVVPPKDVTPSGSPIRVSCEVVTRTWANRSALTYPVCAWADGNTWARVADMTFNTAMNVDLKAPARTTLRIRSEMVKPLR